MLLSLRGQRAFCRLFCCSRAGGRVRYFAAPGVKCKVKRRRGRTFPNMQKQIAWRCCLDSSHGLSCSFATHPNHHCNHRQNLHKMTKRAKTKKTKKQKPLVAFGPVSAPSCLLCRNALINRSQRQMPFSTRSGCSSSAPTFATGPDLASHGAQLPCLAGVKSAADLPQSIEQRAKNALCVCVNLPSSSK